MRVYTSLAELQEVFARKRHQQVKQQKRQDKYEGLESCRKNVIKCNCARKLKYCIARS